MDRDSLVFPNAKDWMTWLEEHHAESAGVWLSFAKKGSGITSLTYAEALEAALCFGWIDGQKQKSATEGMWLQRFTPRGARSIWSQVNRTKALVLVDAGLMRPAGLAAIACAKKNGQWEAAYQSVRTATVPADLVKALRKHPGALAFFAELSSQNRYAILFRLQTAKKPETRAKRLEQFVQMLKERRTIHPQKTRTID